MPEIIVSNGGAILGAVAVACLAAYLTGRNAYRARFAAAATKYRGSVLSLLAGLYPVPSDWPRNTMSIRDVLREKFPALQAAVAEYRPHLPFWRRRSFDRAWDNYRLGPEGRQIDLQDYWQYVPIKGTSVAHGVTHEYDQTQTYQAVFKAKCGTSAQLRARDLTLPSSGRSKGRCAPFGPPLMSNVRPLKHGRIAQ